MFTIGEFAKQSGVSARMLRHYDAIGLLRPACIEQNGYRRYDPAQLASVRQIETLKSYGFPLSEIAAVRALPPAQLAQRIHERRLRAYRELDEKRKAIRRMEDEIMKMEGIDMIEKEYPVIVMHMPAQTVFGIRERISIGETHALFQRLYQEMENRGLRRCGATQLLYHGKEFSYENMDVEAQAVTEPGADTVQIPEGDFAAVTHVGAYETLHYAYEALNRWMEQHPEYEICGPAIERYLKDEKEARTQEELETGVLFPVKTVK